MTKFSPVFARRTPLSITISTIFASAMLPTLATAADTLDTNIPSTTVDPIVVTATRTPTLVSDTIAQTRVIDQEELQRYQGQTVLEVLKKQPGISIKQDGGMGQSANFYLRGYDSKRVLVLIDGIRYGSMSSGQPALSLLPTDQVDRIEVLYGASGSSIYGSDAMGGVIQIFTKGSDANSSTASVTAGVGSHEHYLYGATAQWVETNSAGGKNVISVSASHNKTDGISALDKQVGVNRDKDGFKSDNAAIAISTQLNGQWQVGATGLYAKSTTEFDDSNATADAHIDQRNGAYSVFTKFQQDNSAVNLTAGQSIDKLDNSVGDAFETTQSQVTLTGSYQLPVGQMLAGAEWLKQNVAVDAKPSSGAASTYQFTKDNRTIKSGFLGYQLTNNRYDLQANVRHDANSQFDNETTYGAGFALKIIDNLRVGANYATGFRAPTLNDLYVQSKYYIPNPDLKVETSKNYEAFIEFNTPNHTTRLTGYNTDAENLINNEYDAGTGKYIATNINKAKLKGLSLTSEFFIDNYIFGGHYSHDSAENDSGVNEGKQLVYRPKDSGLIYAGYQNDTFDVRGEIQYVGERYNSNDNSTKLDSYTLLNIAGNYYLTPSLKLSSRINNLTNTDYATNETFGKYGTRYNQDGTNFMTSLTYTWF